MPTASSWGVRPGSRQSCSRINWSRPASRDTCLPSRGENRLSGQSRDSAIQTLAQVGHPRYEVPLGPTIPAYYGLVASRYMHETGTNSESMAVLMRRHACLHPGAQFRDPITGDDVMAFKPIAAPLRIPDCCPVSDGGAAAIVSRERTGEIGVRIIGSGQADTHQHVSAAASLTASGLAEAAGRVGKHGAGR